MHPVEQAVLPQKEHAVEYAARWALTTIENVLQDLEANDWDQDRAAPRPGYKHDRRTYNEMLGRVQLFESITKAAWVTRSPQDPNTRVRDEEKEKRFVDDARKNAALQYDAFVAKLVSKIGDDVTEAKIDGSHVWGHSILTITRTDGTVEYWKTQQILKSSKLGKLHNQWPSRQVKSPK